MMKVIKIVSIFVIMGLAIVTAQAGVVYSEDFEGCTAGQSVSAAPLNWTLSGDMYVGARPSGYFDSLAIDGSEAGYRSGVHVAYVSIPSPSEAAETYTLHAKIRCGCSGGNGFTTTGAASIGLADDMGYMMASIYRDGVNDPHGWTFDTRGMGGVMSSVRVGFDVDEVLDAWIVVDPINGKVLFKLEYSGGTLEESQDIDPNQVPFIASVEVYQDLRIYQGGIDVDDIAVYENGLDSCAEVWALGFGMTKDFDQDCGVDMADLAIFCEDWLRCNKPNGLGCEEY